MKLPKGDILLSRDAFREGTYERDGHKCVRCGRTATPDGKIKLDAHHVMERRLWTYPEQFGGYYLNNGATLCDTGYEKLDGEWSCHLMAGMTLISPDEVRALAGIDKVILPNGIYGDLPLTVWADSVMPNGKRMRGPLFYDESVQKMLQLGGVLDLYTKYVRHPKTPHHPLSPKVLGKNLGDDTVMPDLEKMKGKRIIVTAKMDGGGQSAHYDDYMHLRTPDFKSDPGTHRLQNFNAKLKAHIYSGWRIMIENLVGSAVTGIQYANLPAPFMAFMVWDEKNVCRPWDETVEYIAMIDEILKKECNEPNGLPLVPALYDGAYDEDAIVNCMKPTLNGDPLEGLVVRLADEFHYGDFSRCVGKLVRAHHVVRHDGIYIPNHWITEGYRGLV